MILTLFGWPLTALIVIYPQGAQGPPGGIGAMGGVGEKVRKNQPVQMIVEALFSSDTNPKHWAGNRFMLVSW